MGKHAFGGDWTTDKLERLRQYLCAYTRIFNKNPRARYFKTFYVDAFAGTGERTSSTRPGQKELDLSDADAHALQKGSARIALEVEPAFDRYVFIEEKSQRVRDLEKLCAAFPERAQAIQIERADANDFLKRWCEQTDWHHYRAVVFLDPYGMQVDWATVQAVAATRAIDLWMLFPLGVAVNRLLTKNEPPPAKWAEALNRMFGTEKWRPAFYAKKKEPTLFGEEESERKDATFDRIGRFLLERLKGIFARVAPEPLQLRNSRNVPIYLFCFAAGNPKGAPTAVKIAAHILK